MENDNRRNVIEIYDKIADWFAENRDIELIEKPYLDKMIFLLPPKAKILDLGCGTGKPIMQYLLSKGFEVAGADASKKILEIAISNFPKVEFILTDMRALSLNRTFDAIIAWNSFFHLASDDQPEMFSVFEKHLNPGGVLLFTSGTENGEVWGVNGGENLFHGSLGTEEYKKLMIQHNFEVLEHKINDKDCGFATIWMAQYNPK